MSSDTGSYSQEANRARVASGMKGGEFFVKPAPPAKLNIVECPPTVTEKFEAKEVPMGTPIAPWNSRR